MAIILEVIPPKKKTRNQKIAIIMENYMIIDNNKQQLKGTQEAVNCGSRNVFVLNNNADNHKNILDTLKKETL